MSIPNELVQGIVDIKTAIENKSADTPVDIPDRDYPDELCEALGAIKTAIENKTADTPVEIPDIEYPDELCEALGAVKDAIVNSESGGGGVTRHEGTIAITNGTTTSQTCYWLLGVSGDNTYDVYPYGGSQGTGTSNTKTLTNPPLVNGEYIYYVNKGNLNASGVTNCTIRKVVKSSWTAFYITPTDAACSFRYS